MITKLKYLILFVVCLTTSSFTLKTDNKRIDINDKVITDQPIINDSMVYYKENGEKINAYCQIKFNEGYETVQKYLDRAYYNNYYRHNNNEYNVREYFFVLFDKDLNIVEIRILYRKYRDKQHYPYDKVLVEAIRKSKGRWYTTAEGKEWYVAFFSYNVL